MSKRTYNEKTLDPSSLVGRTILDIKINSDKDAIKLTTDDGEYFLSWDGDCCAHCYIQHISMPAKLIGSIILEAEHSTWSYIKNDRDNCEVEEAMGTKIKTDQGYFDIETRVSHNGYYGGMINISMNGFVDQYSCLRDDVICDQVLEDF